MTEPPAGTFGIEIRLGSTRGIDAEELDELTSALGRELLEVADVETVWRPTEGPPPPGARGLDVIAVGTLLVTLARSGPGLKAVTGAVRAWLSGQPDRSVEVTIDGDTIVVKRASSTEQERLITAFIERHAEG